MIVMGEGGQVRDSTILRAPSVVATASIDGVLGPLPPPSLSRRAVERERSWYMGLENRTSGCVSWFLFSVRNRTSNVNEYRQQQTTDQFWCVGYQAHTLSLY